MQRNVGLNGRLFFELFETIRAARAPVHVYLHPAGNVSFEVIADVFQNRRDSMPVQAG